MNIEKENNLFSIRKKKLKYITENYYNPYEQNWEKINKISTILSNYKENENVSIAGRIVSFRVMGKIIFFHLFDSNGKIQIYVNKNEIKENEYSLIKKLDLGDIIGVNGVMFRTLKGEISIKLKEFKLLSKSIRPLPEKWHGLTDNEKIYRYRYLDLIVNPESKNRLINRSKIIQKIREFLWKKDFLEVETPILQHTTGGALAMPFKTYIKSLKYNLKLRISLELYLKRILVGGIDKIFEIGKVFRNEGISTKHNPEFTLLEVYQAYSSYENMMELTAKMIKYISHSILGTTSIQNKDGKIIDLGGIWQIKEYTELIIEKTKKQNWFSLNKNQMIEFCHSQLNLKFINHTMKKFQITHYIFEKLIEPMLIQPTFVIKIPQELCPLAKNNKKNNKLLDVFELCINGQEIAPGYSEQNNPFLQKEMIEKYYFDNKNIENIEDLEIDKDFLIALEYGMPPAGGFGVGIDRLIGLLTGSNNIKDTIFFPLMKKA